MKKKLTERQKFASLGGKARAAKLSKERRSEIGSSAARARWGRLDKNTKVTSTT